MVHQNQNRTENRANKKKLQTPNRTADQNLFSRTQNKENWIRTSPNWARTLMMEPPPLHPHRPRPSPPSSLMLGLIGIFGPGPPNLSSHKPKPLKLNPAGPD